MSTIVKQARAGLSPAQIAKSLRLTEGAVQAALAYAQWHRQRERPRKVAGAA